MEHAADAVVTASGAAATTNIYARAGIDLQAALRQATQGSWACGREVEDAFIAFSNVHSPTHTNVHISLPLRRNNNQPADRRVEQEERVEKERQSYLSIKEKNIF